MTWPWALLPVLFGPAAIWGAVEIAAWFLLRADQ